MTTPRTTKQSEPYKKPYLAYVTLRVLCKELGLELRCRYNEQFPRGQMILHETGILTATGRVPVILIDTNVDCEWGLGQTKWCIPIYKLVRDPNGFVLTDKASYDTTPEDHRMCLEGIDNPGAPIPTMYFKRTLIEGVMSRQDVVLYQLTHGLLSYDEVIAAYKNCCLPN